jgi:hypothetical protein
LHIILYDLIGPIFVSSKQQFISKLVQSMLIFVTLSMVAKDFVVSDMMKLQVIRIVRNSKIDVKC